MTMLLSKAQGGAPHPAGAGDASREVAVGLSGRARGSAGRPDGHSEPDEPPDPAGPGAPAENAPSASGRSRDRYLDLLRVVSLAAVIVGHWLITVLVVTPAGDLTTTNALGFMPGLEPITWFLQVMAVFFFVGGAAHSYALHGLRRRGGGYADFLYARTSRLLGPTLAFAAAWSSIAVLTELTGLRRGVLDVVMRIVAQPLWFLAVYLGVVALAPLMLRLHERFGAVVLVVMAVVLCLSDLGRIRYGLGALGIVNYLLCWPICHQAGLIYAEKTQSSYVETHGSRTRELAIGSTLFVAGLGVLVLATTIGPYPSSMVGMPGASFSNLNPPSAVLLAQAAMLIGLVLMMRAPVTRWLARERVWRGVVLANSTVMTAFLWHLTAAFLLMGTLAGFALAPPVPGSPAWWLTRPLWIAVLACLLFLLVLMFRRFELAGHREALALKGSSTIPAATRPGSSSVTTTNGVPNNSSLRAVVGATGVVFASLGILGYAVHGFVLAEGRRLNLHVAELGAIESGVLLVSGWLLVRIAGRPKLRKS